MIYLDYSATTPVNNEVLKTFIKVNQDYPGNYNSLHNLGLNNKKLANQATNQIKQLLNIKNHDIIYTSGASEANNLAIKGIIDSYPNRGKHIITTNLEHSSILEPLKYLEKKGYKIDYVNIKKDGLVDLDHLAKLINEETILVTIASVSSELGLLQPIQKIAQIVNGYPKCFFHCDMTQSIGKINIPLDDIDLISFSAHKFYGLKSMGALIKKDKLLLTPIIHGGSSITNYRSGTPDIALIVSMAKALRISIDNIETNYNYVKELNDYLTSKLSKIDKITINSTINSIPHIVNFSVQNIKPETLLHALEENDIYISTKSACSSNKNESLAVLTLTDNHDLALSSLRISLSYLTTKNELDTFINVLKKCLDKLSFK